MSNLTKKIEAAIKTWATDGIPQWKIHKSVVMQLQQFKREQWQADAIEKNLTDLDYLDWNDTFTARYPDWRGGVEHHTAEFHRLKEFDPMSDVLFEDVDQLARVHDIMLDQIWKISRVTNQILNNEKHFLESVGGSEDSGGSARSAEDMGEAAEDLNYG